MFLQCLGECCVFCQKLAGVILGLVEFAGSDAGSDAGSLLEVCWCDSRAFSADFCCCSVVFAGSDTGACWRSSSIKMHFMECANFAAVCVWWSCRSRSLFWFCL
ncbi:hypothetical protein Patl1_35525 [Pistacia atlantica]|nr:hypothetical protein Patl1_35525 [Pistacia atlantica]